MKSVEHISQILTAMISLYSEFQNDVTQKIQNIKTSKEKVNNLDFPNVKKWKTDRKLMNKNIVPLLTSFLNRQVPKFIGVLCF